MKLRKTISKYHSWYLFQTSLIIMLLPIQIYCFVLFTCNYLALIILFQGFSKITLNHWEGSHWVCYRGVRFWYINLSLVKVWLMPTAQASLNINEFFWSRILNGSYTKLIQNKKAGKLVSCLRPPIHKTWNFDEFSRGNRAGRYRNV